MSEIKKELHYSLKGAVYGLVLMTVLWLFLSGVVVLTFGSLERIILIASVGIPFWGITWSIAGAVIGFVGVKSLRWKLVGAICGIIIGIFSAILFINWARCDYGNMIDKVLWAIPMAIELPVMSLFILSDMFLKKTVGVTLYQGDFFVISVLIIISAILWTTFGVILGKSIGRQPKIKMR